MRNPNELDLEWVALFKGMEFAGISESVDCDPSVFGAKHAVMQFWFEITNPLLPLYQGTAVHILYIFFKAINHSTNSALISIKKPS